MRLFSLLIGLLPALLVAPGGAAEPPPRPKVPGFPAEAVVPLKNGLNRVDLDGDGRDDLVVKSRMTWHTAHDWSNYLFLRDSPDDDREKWQLLPFEPEDDSALKRRYSLSTHEGAELLLRDVRLLILAGPDGGRETVAVVAERALGESYPEPQNVEFQVYALTWAEDRLPGEALISFKFRRKFPATRQYAHVGDAFLLELGLPDPDPHPATCSVLTCRE